MTGESAEALEDPKAYYDARYREGYMEGFEDVYEICRIKTVREVLGALKRRGFMPESILDYGCGEGRYLAELRSQFPSAKVAGCDISDAGLRIAKGRHPKAELISMQDESIAAPNSSFDFVLSIEVLEHVQDVGKAVREIGRVLRPGGKALITTPCANRFSGEWLQMALSGGLEPSSDGYGRFRSDEPGHLRRLNDRQFIDLFQRAGCRVDKIYHRAHVFMPLVETVGRRLPMQWRARIAMLDWHLLKHFPNGATMLALISKE